MLQIYNSDGHDELDEITLMQAELHLFHQRRT